MTSAVDTAKAIYHRQSEPLRFLVVGGWNTAFSYALFAVMLWAIGPVLAPWATSDDAFAAWIGEHYYLAVQWLSWLIAVWHSTWTFKVLVFHSKGHFVSEVARSYFVYLPLQGFNSLLLWLLVSKADLHPLVGQLVTVGVAAVLSYMGHKYFTFKSTEQPAD